MWGSVVILRIFRSFFKIFTRPKKGYTRRTFWGRFIHYDKNGNKIGWSRMNFWGGKNRYNNQDELISYTRKNFWGGYNL